MGEAATPAPEATATWPRGVIVGSAVAIIVSALVANAFLARPWFRELGTSVAWFGVAATLVCSFAASLCLSRRRDPLTVTLGLFFAATTVYMLDITATYDPNRDLVTVLDRLQMCATPILVVCWIRSARQLRSQVTSRSVDAPPHSWRTVALTGLSRWEPPLAWLPAIGFSVAAAGFNMLYREVPRGGPAWRGYWVWHPYPTYYLMAGWATAIGAWGTVTFLRARQADLSGLRPGVAEVALWAPRFAAAFFVVALAIIYGTFTSIWPEAVLDLVVALLMCGFALVVVDADAYRDADRAYASLRDRATGAASLLVLAMAVLAISGGSVGRHVLLATVLGAGIPLAVTAAGRMRGVRDIAHTTTPSAIETEDIERLLTGSAERRGHVSTVVIAATKQSLEALDGEGLRRLLGALPSPRGRRNEFGDPREDPRLTTFIAAFTPLGPSTSWDLRLMRLARIVHETARTLDSEEAPTRADPSRWRILAAYCADRIDERLLAQDGQEREAERLRYQLWRYGRNARPGKPGFVFHGELDAMPAEALRAHLASAQRRDTDDRCKKVIRRSLQSATEETIRHWTQQLARGQSDD